MQSRAQISRPSSWRNRAKPSPIASSRRAATGWRIFCAIAGLKRLDHYAVFMENHSALIECCAAGERSGLYYTCVNSFLTARRSRLYRQQQPLEGADHVAGEARRRARGDARLPDVKLCLIVDGPGDGDRVLNLDEATAGFPATPIDDESLGAAMLYSSGTTGRPKGVLRRSAVQPPAAAPLGLAAFDEALAIPRGARLSLPCAALSFRAAYRRQPHDPRRRNGRDHGAFRRGALSSTCRDAIA